MACLLKPTFTTSSETLHVLNRGFFASTLNDQNFSSTEVCIGLRIKEYRRVCARVYVCMYACNSFFYDGSEACDCCCLEE